MLSLPLLHPILFVHENTVHACDFHLSWYWAVGGACYTEYSITVAVSHIICIDTVYSHISHLTYHPSIHPFLHRTPRMELISASTMATVRRAWIAHFPSILSRSSPSHVPIWSLAKLTENNLDDGCKSNYYTSKRQSTIVLQETIPSNGTDTWQ